MNKEMLLSLIPGIADKLYTGKKEKYGNNAYNSQCSKIAGMLYNTYTGIDQAYNAQYG